MKFLIAGLGSIGRRHLTNLLSLGQDDIVLYRTGHSTLTDLDQYNFPVETSLESALRRKPDAVIVSNPTSLHLDVAIPAAQVGCHLLIEKPLSNSMDRIDELISAVQHGGGKVLIGFQFRFHPGLQQVKKWIDGGEIGRPLSVRAHWGEYLPGWHPWEDYRSGYSARMEMGGGVLLTLCHPLDYLRWILGEFLDIWSFSGKLSGLAIQVEDTAEIGLRFTNGMLGSVHLNYFQRPYTHYLSVSGANGTINWDNIDGSARIFHAGDGIWETSVLPDSYERNSMFLEEMRHFIELIQGNSTSFCGLEDSVKTLEVVLAAHRSQQLGALVHLN